MFVNCITCVFLLTLHNLFGSAHTTSVPQEEIMKKLVIGVALGVIAGMALSEVPQVKQMLGKGKRKLKDMSK